MLRRGQAPRDADGHFVAWGAFTPRDRDGRALPLSALPAWVAEKVREGKRKLAQARRAEVERRAEAERAERAERRRQRAERARAEQAAAEAARQEQNRRRRERAQAQREARRAAEALEAERAEQRRQRAEERRRQAQERAAAERAAAERVAAERAAAERVAAEAARAPRDASGQLLTPSSTPRNKVGNPIDWSDVRVVDAEGATIAPAAQPRWLREKIAEAIKERAADASRTRDRGAEIAAQIERDRRRFGPEIVTAQEVLEAVLVEARNEALRLGLIEHWKSDPVLVRNGSRGSLGRRIALGSLLDRDLAADVRAIVADVAEEIVDTMRDGNVKVYVSIFLTEFGKNLIGSPTAVVMELPEGTLTQGWQAVKGGVPHRVGRRVGALLEKILSQSPRNAAIVEGVVVRGYYMRGGDK